MISEIRGSVQIATSWNVLPLSLVERSALKTEVDISSETFVIF
jgi:hypothetical protein